MYPEIHRFHLFGKEIPINSYGLMMVVGFLLAAHWAKRLARQRGLNGEIFINAALLALVTGIIGARASHILENWSEFMRPDRTIGQNLWAMVNLQSGGLTYYGGFLLAFPALVAYGLWKQVPIRTGMDIVAPCLMIGLGFGRIGCYLFGCCHGAGCDPKAVPWAVQFPYHSMPYVDQWQQGELKDIPAELLQPSNRKGTRGVELIDPKDIQPGSELARLAATQWSRPVHPAQIYSAITAFLLAALLWAYFTVPHVAGRVFALMLMLEGGTRFLLETLRAEPAVAGSMSLSMLIGIGLAALGVGLWVLFGRMSEERAPGPGALAPNAG